MTRQQLLSIASYAAVFALGAVSGGSVVHAQAARSDATVFDDKAAGRHRLYVWSLEKKLGLRPDQRARVEAILTSHEGEREAITSPLEPRLKELRMRIRAEIRATLTEEQQREYDAIMRRYDESRGREPTPAASP